jgi:predicted  nucleic acid-binding Zn-ribbon protein
MSQEVVQWLNEIKTLQQQVADLQAKLAASEASADNWRGRYDAEAQQHRNAVTQAQTQLARLDAQVAAFANPVNPTTLAIDLATAAQLDRLTPTALKQKLAEIWAERDQMEQALKAEHQAHDKTRKDLTTALADAMEVLSKAKRSPAIDSGRLDDPL